MKFKALMKDGQHMREFQNIVLTLSKLTKECVIEMQKEHLCFIANEESGTPKPLVWVDIDTKVNFSEYYLEMEIATQTKVMLSVSAIQLSRALALLKSNVRQCKLKLMNKQFPSLTVEVEVWTQKSNQTRNVSHEIPITIIPRKHWNHYDLPQKPKSKLILNIPADRFMRGLIDKMKNVTPTIIFYATSGGVMNLVAETEMATITTNFKNLDIIELNPTEAERNKEQIEASCSVDCKKTAMFFSALHVPNNQILCGIENERLIHLEANFRPGIVIHSILPAVCV